MNSLSLRSWTVPGILLAALLLLRFLDPLDISQYGLAWVTSNSHNKSSPDIIIVDIDADSQTKYGKWPFDRKDLANLVNRMRTEGAGAIILDLPLQDPDRARGDEELSRALAAKGIILVQQVSDQGGVNAYTPKKFQGLESSNLEKFAQYNLVVSPLPKLVQSSSGLGTVDFLMHTGLYNKFPLVTAVDGTLHASPIIEALRYTVHESNYDFKSTGRGLRIGIGQFLNIPVDSSGKFYINYDHEFEVIKLSKHKLKAVKNKIVIVGSSIAGVNQQLITPNGQLHSHVIQAHALQTVLDGPPPLRSPFVILIEITMAISAYLALWYFWQRSQDLINLVKLALIVGITAGVPFLALTNINVLFDPIWPTVISFAPVVYILYVRYRAHFRCYICRWICADIKHKGKS